MFGWFKKLYCAEPVGLQGGKKERRPASPIVDLRDLADDPPDLDVPKSELPETDFCYTSKSRELRLFSYEELQIATLNFRSPDRVLGEGGFGKVYKGFFYNPERRKVLQLAIKQLNPGSFQGETEWMAEIVVLGPLRHANLVRLVGYCDEEGRGMLIYEYMARGSLDYYLFKYEGKVFPPLSWDIRVRVALHAAKGLAYLHRKKIIHRDFKAPNILIDENFNAKLTDFGLAKGADNDQTHITTRIMGTLGYLDPRYMETGQLTLKSDVYSFGIMLLELITGRRAQAENEIPLVQWSERYIRQRKADVASLLDPDLSHLSSNDNVIFAVQTLAIVARRCLSDDPSERPDMAEMVDLIGPLLKR